MISHQANLDALLSGDIVLTAQDIIELGLDVAPDDIGPSVEEAAVGQHGGRNHG
jgi:hypothetical protein